MLGGKITNTGQARLLETGMSGSAAGDQLAMTLGATIAMLIFNFNLVEMIIFSFNPATYLIEYNDNLWSKADNSTNELN